jgi:hypothetical protein
MYRYRRAGIDRHSEDKVKDEPDDTDDALALSYIRKGLSGQNGLVYLLFLGRETSAVKVVEELESPDLQNAVSDHRAVHILADAEAQVYFALSRLKQRGYVNTIRPKGRDKIRTSDPEPYFRTYELLGFGLNRRMESEKITRIGRYLNLFPYVLAHMFARYGKTIRKMTWDDLLAEYAVFLSVLGFASARNLKGKKIRNKGARFMAEWMNSFFEDANVIRKSLALPAYDYGRDPDARLFSWVVEKLGGSSDEDKIGFLRDFAYTSAEMGPKAYEAMPVWMGKWRSREMKGFLHVDSKLRGSKRSAR